MVIGDNMKYIKVYTKTFNNNDFDYIKFSITIPLIQYTNYLDDFDDVPVKKFTISVGNLLTIAKSRDYWSFQFSIFGFGIHIFRQWGY